MRRRHTRKTDKDLATGSVQKVMRLPIPLVDQVSEAIEGGIPDISTLTDATTDALWLWLYEAKKATELVVATRFAAEVPAPLSQPEPDLSETPRPDSNGRPNFKELDLTVEDA